MNYGPQSSRLHSTFGEHAINAEDERKNVNEFMTGLVTDNDHKKDGQPLGWVKVKYHWNDQDTTGWAPVVMQGAGKNRGWFFIPEIDDEVLMAMTHGSFQQPVVLGALWNGKDKPADTNPGKVPRRTIKSRGKQPGKGGSSADGGSTFTFDDENQKVIIADGQKYAQITFDAKAKKITIETLKADADIAFQAPQGDIKIVAKAIEIAATGTFKAKSGQDLKISTNAGATLKASGKTTWSGSTHKDNCGGAQNVTAPTSDPQDVADPYST